MQIKTPPPVHSVVKREDKTENLRAFIATFLGQASRDTTAELTLVARSAESPLARALVALGAEIAECGLSVRAIFGQLESEKSLAGWSVAGPEIAFRRELRWAKNPRLADAHEQLVLDPETCWVGDCLRRDPSRRDAYEHYMAGDASSASTLRISFGRLWSASLPLMIRTPHGKSTPVSGIADSPEMPLAALTARDDNSGPLASSPH